MSEGRPPLVFHGGRYHTLGSDGDGRMHAGMTEGEYEVSGSDNRWSAKHELICRLTSREHEVFLMLGEGLNNHDISQALAVSHRTVKFHVTSVLRKLEVESRLQAGLAAAEYIRWAATQRSSRPPAVPVITSALE